MEVKSFNDIISGSNNDREGIDFLSNGILDISDDVIVPEPVIKWSMELLAHTSSCLYLLRMEDHYGVMAINEYDSATMENLYSDDRSAMQAGMRRDAELLSGLDCAKDFQVFVGNGTGCQGCDEICVLIPFETPHEKALALLMEIDATVYSKQSEDVKAQKDRSPNQR